MPICFGNNQANLYNTNVNQNKLNKTSHTMEKNATKLKELRTEFIDIIEKVAKKKLTTDNMIVFNEPIYLSDDTYKNDDSIDAMIIGDNGEEIILLQEDEEVGDLVGMTTDTLAEIADIIESGNYEIDD